MRQLVPIAMALLLVTCGGAPQRAASSAPPPASPSPTIAAVATPTATYAPNAEGFSSKILIEKPRELSTSAPGYIWIVAGTTTKGGVSAVVSERETFTASYQAPAERRATDGERVAYATPDLPPLAVGRYTEGLRLVVVQPGGRSAAHMHSGIEGVLVLEGRVLIRSAGNAPAFLDPGQGFYILPKVGVQLINVGNAVARTLVYSISPEGAPFSTELDRAP
ncbi:MAG: cupin domain-containing protein [Chloroflexota bacterium]|nr:cupin domain-containing protein [Chloroflexota bacterium]